MTQPTKLDHLEVLALAKHGGSLWSLVTTAALSHVTQPGFFKSRFADFPLRRHDKILVIASYNAEPQYLTLVVAAVDNRGEVTLPYYEP
jgi:hypothetical protein